MGRQRRLVSQAEQQRRTGATAAWRARAFSMTAALLCALMALTACSGSGSDKSDDGFAFGYPTAASTLDPHRGGSFDLIYTDPIFDSLIATDEDGEYVPALASEWELADDAMSLTLTLREGVKFQDGEEMTAESVVASLERARAAESSVSGDLATVTAIAVVDATHVSLTFSSPSGHILGALSTEAGMIISPKSIDSEEIGQKPVGAGPYKVVKFAADSVIYEASDEYWDTDSVKVKDLEIRGVRDDSARLRALTSGQLDAAYLRPSQKKEIESGGNKIVSGKRSLVYTMQLNTASGPLADGAVRKAVLQAIDREAINVNLQSGGCTPTVQPFIDGYYPYVEALDDPSVLEPDTEQIKQDLAAAGYGPDNPVTFTISSSNISQYQQLAEVVQDQLSEVGIAAELNVVESTQGAATIREGKFDAYVTPIDVGRPDPTSFVADYYLPGGGSNPGNFEVPGMTEQLTQARSTDNVDEQTPVMQDIISAAYDAGPPVIPLCAPENVIGVSESISNLVVPPAGTYDFRGVEVSV